MTDVLERSAAATTPSPWEGPAWLTRRLAAAIVIVVAGLVGWGLVAGPDVPAWAVSTSRVSAGHHDAELYREIATRVAAGGDYYQVALPLQQAWGFPTAPAATVREPLEAWTIAALGETGAKALILALLAAGMILLLIRLEKAVANRSEWVGAILMLLVAASWFISPSTTMYTHEGWAMVLILLSLAVRTDRRWWPAILIGVAAVMFRETALIYLGAMGLVALLQHRWRETVGWAAGGVAWLGFYVWHIQQVAAVPVAGSRAAVSWLAFGGWPFIVSSVRFGSGLVLAPYWVAAVLVPLAMFGWLFARGQVGLRTGVTAAMFGLVFLVVGRDINLYWGLLYAAVVLPGLAFAPRGIRTVARQFRPVGHTHLRAD